MTELGETINFLHAELRAKSAEIERLNTVVRLGSESITEKQLRIEFLEKVAEQMHAYGQCPLTTCENHCGRTDTVWNHCTDNHAVMPELAAWLKEKENG